MWHALFVAVDIPAMLPPHVTVIQYFEMETLLTPQNIVCQMHVILYIVNKKELQNKIRREAEPNQTKLSKTICRHTKPISRKTSPDKTRTCSQPLRIYNCFTTHPPRLWSPSSILRCKIINNNININVLQQILFDWQGCLAIQSLLWHWWYLLWHWWSQCSLILIASRTTHTILSM